LLQKPVCITLDPLSGQAFGFGFRLCPYSVVKVLFVFQLHCRSKSSFEQSDKLASIFIDWIGKLNKLNSGEAEAVAEAEATSGVSLAEQTVAVADFTPQPFKGVLSVFETIVKYRAPCLGA
jgi:hypothetical protein